MIILPIMLLYVNIQSRLRWGGVTFEPSIFSGSSSLAQARTPCSCAVLSFCASFYIYEVLIVPGMHYDTAMGWLAPLRQTNRLKSYLRCEVYRVTLASGPHPAVQKRVYPRASAGIVGESSSTYLLSPSSHKCLGEKEAMLVVPLSPGK